MVIYINFAIVFSTYLSIKYLILRLIRLTLYLICFPAFGKQKNILCTTILYFFYNYVARGCYRFCDC